MHRVVAAVARERCLPPALTHDAIGDLLFAMNAAAMMARYSDLDDDEKSPPPYIYAERKPSESAMFRALECFLYQCSEGAVPETGLFRLITRVRDAVEARLTGHAEPSKSRHAMAWRMSEAEPWDF